MIPIVSREDAEKTERKMSQRKNNYHDIMHQRRNESPSAIVQMGFDRFTDERLGWSKKPFSFLTPFEPRVDHRETKSSYKVKRKT